MTTNIRVAVVALSICVTLSVLATNAGAQERCTNASLVGSYAFSVAGQNVEVPLPGGPGPFHAIGKNTYDGSGHLAGSIVISSNGLIIPAVFAGTYHVRPDCTGHKSATLTIAGKPGPTVDFDFVIDDDLREIRMIVSDTGFAVSGTARKLVTDRRRARDN
jgi:hypothetical protein